MLAITVAGFALVTGLLFAFFPYFDNFFSGKRRFPPGPRALPIIGHLHLLGALPHRALRDLSKKHGPVMQIRLGNVRTVVISSPEAAEQVLKAQDSAFASRPSMEASKYLIYGARGMAFTPYGPEWRHVRKLCTLQLLTAARVESSAPIRWRGVAQAVEGLRKAAERKEVVDLSEKVSDVVEELTIRMMVGAPELDTVEFKSLSKEGIRLIGIFNLADYVPFLGLFDLQGLTREMKKLSIATDKAIDEMIAGFRKQSSEHKSRRENHDTSSSFAEVLLSILDDPDEDHSLKLVNIKAIIVEMVTAAFDTSLTAIEWTLSELLRHPPAMARVHRELNDVVGLDRMVDEADLPKLAYLDMAIMESFRLHPVAPLLIPRESVEDAEIDGFFVPKKTRVLVNSWAIGRDPSAWPGDTEAFVPERFEGCEAGYRGNDFRFLPFGSGRRGCPGMQMGLATVRLVVAQLVHCFTWELPDRKFPEKLDMTEKFGLTVPRAEHLLAVPTYRLRAAVDDL